MMDGISRVSGYRIFCNEQLQDVKQKIELETGKKANISSLQRELSKLWNNLAEEERQICREKAQTLAHNDPAGVKHLGKRLPSVSPFQNYRIKNILALDSKIPKFTASAITLINDAMASFLDQLAQLADRYVTRAGEGYPIRPHHIVGGIDQGDDSVSFLKEAIEYVNKDKSNGINRVSVKRAKEHVIYDVDNLSKGDCNEKEASNEKKLTREASDEAINEKAATNVKPLTGREVAVDKSKRITTYFRQKI